MAPPFLKKKGGGLHAPHIPPCNPRLHDPYTTLHDPGNYLNLLNIIDECIV
jgi:hypothetical protein